jgi:hypothetical protein
VFVAMKRSARTLTLGLLSAVPLACASTGSPRTVPTGDAALPTVIAAERAFARHSESAGIKESFSANLAPDGILFRPGPVNGLQWLNSNPPSPGYLSWEPSTAAVAQSGDMGFTTGPWEFRTRGASDTVSRAGHYVTVWKRDSTGAWKVALDIGTSHRPLPRPTDAAGRVLPAVESLGMAGWRARLFQRDSLIGAGGVPQADALLPVFADDGRLHRERDVPALGIAAVRAALADDKRPYYAKPIDLGVSRGGEFGYSYGEYELVASMTRPRERGYYLRLWRRGDDGASCWI